MEKKCIAFIDILGFSQYVKDYDLACIQEFFNTIEQFVNPKSFVYIKNNPFETFLISSDSIIATAKEKDANKFIDAICEFFNSCFVFTQNGQFNKDNPFEIEMMHIDLNGKIRKEKTYWLPPLFRCGISYGEIELPKMSSIDWIKGENSIEYGKPQVSNRTNVYGKAVLEAIYLEREKTKGAKIFIDTAFECLLDKKHKDKIITEVDIDGKFVRYYPWTVTFYRLLEKLPKNGINEDYLRWNNPEIREFTNEPQRMLDRLIRIYNYYNNKVNNDSSDINSLKATEQYLATIKMVMHSILIETNRIWGHLYNGIANKRIKATLLEYSEKHNLPVQL